jgi:rod shape determining protein RodA
MAQPDFGSVIVFFALVFPLYREGFPGEVLFFFFLLVILFVLALLLSQHALLIIILALGFAGLAIGARRHKEALIGAAALVVFYFLFVAINKWFRLGFHQYAILLLSSGIVALALLIYSFVRWIRSIAVVIIMVVMAFALTFSVDYVFDHFLAPHQQTRINILLGKESDLKGAEYNVNQSKIAIGSGGFAGKGYLQGTQTKFNFVPEQSTDFIFCTVGEEWGFVGSFLVLLLFGGLLLRLIMMAERQRSVFSRIYGYSVVSILFFHVSINVGMTIGLLPVIGIPLPFFSYGGSSLWAFTILLFIFIRLDASRLELLR